MKNKYLATACEQILGYDTFGPMLKHCGTTAKMIADGCCPEPEQPAALYDLLTHVNPVCEPSKRPSVCARISPSYRATLLFAGRSGTPSARLTLDGLVDSCAHMNFAEIPVRRASPWVSGGEQVHLRAPH